MKRILGLDLGTNSIGWALVNEKENEQEKSSIIKLGARVNPLTVDEQQNFEQGKPITTNEAPQEKPVVKVKEPKKRISAGMKRFEENLDKYTGVSEQGVAIWLPKEVKKRLEVIRANADRNIPLRSLAAAIIMTIEENEAKLAEL